MSEQGRMVAIGNGLVEWQAWPSPQTLDEVVEAITAMAFEDDGMGLVWDKDVIKGWIEHLTK